MNVPRSTVVVGLQWGDEGKGKISYIFSKKADAVARFQGGGNAGHTVVVDGRRLKFNILPAGSVAGARPVIGAGCVIDVGKLLDEMNMLRSLVPESRPLISRCAHIVLELHKELDGRVEAVRQAPVGTTRMGIGPAYSDKCLRLGLRMSDIIAEGRLSASFNTLLRFHQTEVGDPVTLQHVGSRLAEYVGDVPEYLMELLRGGGRVVFEGAQGTLLDLDHGTYPYVTSSNTVAGAASTGTGIPPNMLETVVGVMKAYTTRVGSGPFPTELSAPLSDRIRSAGAEYGTTTGRPRRVGWLDLPLLRYACMINGVSWIAVTKLDILSNIDTVKVCIRYDLDGREVKSLGLAMERLADVRPVYQEFRGWMASESDWLRAVRMGWDEIPSNAREYLEYIEGELGVRVGLVSVGEEVGLEIPRKD
jgi:adenylosuccinate synthase